MKTLHNFYWFQDFWGPKKSGNQEKSGKISCLFIDDVKIGWGNGLVPLDNKPLPEPVLNMFYDAIWQGANHFITCIMPNDDLAPCAARSSAAMTLNVYHWHWQILLLSRYILCIYYIIFECKIHVYYIISSHSAYFPWALHLISCVSKRNI